MSRQQSFKIPEGIKWFIIEQKRENIHPKDIIANVLDRFGRQITFTTIQRLWEKYQRTGSVSDLPRSGRPKSMNLREERVIVRRFVTQPGTSTKSTVKIQERNQRPISRQTLRRTLRRHGLIRGLPLVVRKLQERMFQKGFDGQETM